ncbi:MAG: PHB depolymerase family esterase [Acetobacteraceae bacterium]|nr:MAG: PHB depolymerase family esterase [Acetobacteraceae bacterium]
MKILPTPTWGAAASGLRTSLSPNDLVMQTLARHGLAPRTEGGTAPAPRTRGPSKATAPGQKSALPEGASFLADQFHGATGTRRYLTYVPSSASTGATGLVVMLHGCTQTPEDFAAGTRMNNLAEKHGFIVVYPHQSRGENAQSCWNWFRRGDQRRDLGEPAILAGLAQKIASDHQVPANRIFVAGLSAGAAMAVILGETYPEVFAGVGAHSGLPNGAAKDVTSAFAAMAGHGPEASERQTAVPVRTIVVHGTADATVNPVNGHRIAQRALKAGPRELVETDEPGRAGGRAFRRTVLGVSEGPAYVEHWEIEGLGHAWSGGSAQGSYTDQSGPDASAAMVDFFFAGTDVAK